MDQSRRPSGCVCIDGASPICPAEHRVAHAPAPEWVRRARAHRLPVMVVGGAPRVPEPVALSDYRRTHQAHPMVAGLDDAYDALSGRYWGRKAAPIEG